MVLSKREKYIGIGAMAAVALLGINGLIVGPYFDRAAALQDDMRTATKTLGDDQNLLRLQKSKQAEWNAMLSNGLQADDSTAQSRTQQMIQTWTRVANINLESINSEHVSTQKGPFQVINFSLDFNTSGPDSMRQIARFLWSIESARIPIRLNDIKIQATREGTDQLNVKLVVSALYMPPTVPGAAAASEMFNELEGMP
ncbi:MAG: hypothetical protein ABSB42_11815 [Tepidisphaeraceae bacterium]